MIGLSEQRKKHNVVSIPGETLKVLEPMKNFFIASYHAVFNPTLYHPLDGVDVVG